MEKMRWIFLVKVILWTSASLAFESSSQKIYVRFLTIKQFLFLLSHYIRTGEQ